MAHAVSREVLMKLCAPALHAWTGGLPVKWLYFNPHNECQVVRIDAKQLVDK